MTSLVLNQQTAAMPLGKVLAAATDQEIQISDESGRLVARILLESSDHSVSRAEANVDEIRRRLKADPKLDITTQELLARAKALAGE